MKKFLTFLLVCSMLFLSSIPVMASTTGEIVGEGNVVVVPHVINVTLPTQGFSFVVDPEGVLPASGQAGSIRFVNANPVVVSRSSAPIRLGVELTVTTAASGDNQVTAVTSETAVTLGDTKNVFVEVSTSTANVTDGSTSFSGSPQATLGTTETTLDFVLPAGDFEVTAGSTAGTWVREATAAPNWQGTRLGLSGRVNPNANWTGDENFGIRIRFAFTPEIPQDMPPAAIVGAAHLRRVLSGTLAYNLATAPAYGFQADSADFRAGVWTNVDFVFPAGTTVRGAVSGATTLTAGNHFRANTADIEANRIAFNFTASQAVRDITVTLSDDSTHSIQLVRNP